MNIGDTLRDARTAQALTIEDVSRRLRLLGWQVEAIEENDFERLGQPVFARGFVRNYARLLGLDGEALIAPLRAEPPSIVPDPKLLQQRPAASGLMAWLVSPWLVALGVGALVLVLVPVGLYLWLNSGSDTREPGAAPTPPLADAAPAARAESEWTAPEPSVSELPAAELSNPALSNPALAAPDAAAPSGTPSTDPLAADGTAATSSGGFEAQPSSAGTSTPRLAAAQRRIELSFQADAWVEVRDGDGKFVHRQLDRAGSRAVIEGRPPFDLVVGNARDVRMTYNGRPIDIKPFIDITVARFTLEE